ncbi:NADPH:adrenodoxin oxidoreductase, mitochondrial-like [Convolutriloba macropyga]|uniref:NADPH:adrenodoxin oxidoreductase, mitochondrial-like n=1 Tax=Convolutriloba macropyga TaxID=536237 RepID=UPI003F526433
MMKRVCIVGSGPAAFFTAGKLLKSSKNTVVDIVEKMPVAHGLVRYGVAPDHQDVKNVENKFLELLHSERLQFFGGIEIGHSITLSTLRKLYNAVVVATGCQKPKSLNLPGEFGSNILSSHEIVNWYNGHPDFCQIEPKLSDTSNAVILGQGNVALDVARILLSKPETLMTSDISQKALECLKQSKIRNVFCVGRRELTNVSFTIKEFRDITKLGGVNTAVCSKKLTSSDLSEMARPKRRLMELCQRFRTSKQLSDFVDIVPSDKSFVVGFNNTPVEFLLNENSQSVEAVKFRPTREEVDESLIQVPTGLVVKCIGYEGVPIDKSLPFDEKSGFYKNENGKIDTGLYCSGWAKTGPVGVIAATLSSSHETADSILRELDALPNVVVPGGVKGYLINKNISFVSGQKWKWLYEEEVNRGKTLNKPRVKFESYFDILKAVNDYN